MARSPLYTASQVAHTSSLCLFMEGALCFDAFRAIKNDKYQQALILFAAAGGAKVLKYLLLCKWDTE